MKRTVSIVIVALTTVIASGCCGEFQRVLNHPFGTNSICEPVHRAHYDNGFEVGYGSECADCGLGSMGPACSCQQYGGTTGCLRCAMHGDGSSSNQPTRMARSGKKNWAVRQASYTTGCNDCMESDPCSGGCAEECSQCCCTPRCPGPCTGHAGPFLWIHQMLNPERYYGGCGEVYLGDFHSYPPDCTDPCNRCGGWTGESNCNAWTGCNVCGQCGSSYYEPCQSCQSHGSGTEVIEGTSSIEGPILISQNDRIARPNKVRTARTQRSGRVTKQR